MNKYFKRDLKRLYKEFLNCLSPEKQKGMRVSKEMKEIFDFIIAVEFFYLTYLWKRKPNFQEALNFIKNNIEKIQRIILEITVFSQARILASLEEDRFKGRLSIKKE